MPAYILPMSLTLKVLLVLVGSFQPDITNVAGDDFVLVSSNGGYPRFPSEQPVPDVVEL